MSKEEKTPETKAEEYVETEFVKEMAVEPVEVPDVTYEGELIGWAEHTPHEHEHHEHHKEDPEELVETEFVKEMAGVFINLIIYILPRFHGNLIF